LRESGRRGEEHGGCRRFGEWLGANGGAICGTRPWIRAEATTDAGLPVRFTQQEGRPRLVIVGTAAGEVAQSWARELTRPAEAPPRHRAATVASAVSGAPREGP
jgi:hypothetical protein